MECLEEIKVINLNSNFIGTNMNQNQNNNMFGQPQNTGYNTQNNGSMGNSQPQNISSGQNDFDDLFS